ncbi:hypothetical protein [Pseudanabaena sp. SR411]|uniref:hypothetical protein n=1 Tax=Pseudanabaena sp. SR411 TaxID=1980935 RepID=UPI0011402842|nr:hypothetical protein [Pseudanabaena sp. SR411]
MNILENNSKRLVIYSSRSMDLNNHSRIWLFLVASLVLVGSYGLLVWLIYSLYLIFLKATPTRTCKFDKTINLLIVETKELLNTKVDKFPLSAILDIVISDTGNSFNGISTEGIDVILNSGEKLSVNIDSDFSNWHQQVQDTVDLIKIFLGFSTKIDGIEKFQINSSDKTSRLCRIVYRSKFWLGDYITSIGDMHVKYDFWGHVTSIGDMPVKYGSSFLVHEHIISIGDMSIKYGSSFGGISFNYCRGSLLGVEYINSIGDMSVYYSFINGVFYITSIGDMSVNYDLRGHIIAIGDMSIQCDSDSRLVEVHSSSGFSSKQFTVLFLLAKLKERPNNN